MPAWFVNLEDSFSYKEAQFKKVCPPVKTDSPPRAAENISENINVLRFLFNYILIGCKILKFTEQQISLGNYTTNYNLYHEFNYNLYIVSHFCFAILQMQRASQIMMTKMMMMALSQ